MNKYISLLRYELKNIIKDRMNMFMMAYPFLMLFITGFVVPEVLTRANADIITSSYINIVLLLMNITIGAMMGGFLLGFSLIENKDEKTFNTIAVTPASIKGYVAFKSLYSTCISLCGNLIIFFGLMLIAGDKVTVFDGARAVPIFNNIKPYHIIVVAITNSLLTPALAMVMASFAKNKVEGFVFAKSGGILILLPILMMLNFFNGATQYILAPLPHFWSAKSIYNLASMNTNAANLNFWFYNIIGVIYTIAITVWAYIGFNRKLQITT
ncbi:MAG: hypothetical protein EOM87_04265 [Clostridia bacterium]|nr:hypothetical protein [Clostridia bacterium]